MGLKSREKGKRGERAACQLLRGMGFLDAIRTAQHSGKETADVVCPNSLPHVHIEVKYGYKSLHVGSSLWHRFVAQARRSVVDESWVLLWKTNGTLVWNATFYWEGVGIVTKIAEFSTDALKGINQRWGT